MADTVTTQTLVDGSINTVIKLTNVSDGSGESAVLKVDVSALNGAPSEVKIEKIWYDIQGMSVRLLWDANTDVDALVLGQGQQKFDFTEIGGVQNNSSTGKTGDLLLTTIGASANDTYTIILCVRKS